MNGRHFKRWRKLKKERFVDSGSNEMSVGGEDC